MHSIVYEIRKKGETIRCELPDWFEYESHYCDYVNEESNEETIQSIDWLKKVMLCERKDNCIILTEEQIKDYLSKLYEKFKKYVSELSTVTLDEYLTDSKYRISSLLYSLKSAFEDEQGFWFLIGGEMYTLEAFLRVFGPGEYEIVRSWDYHF